MTILNNEPIDVGLLIVNNIKYMTDFPQRNCGHMCIINELCWLVGVQAQLDNVMISPMMPISKSTMRKIPTAPAHGEAQ